jgi:hypothetical protein
MRTLLMIAIGVALAFAFDAIAAARNKRDATRALDGGWWFIGIWVAVSAVDFGVGVATGHTIWLELAVHALIFVVPAAVAWYLSRQRRAAGATRMR